MTRTEWLKRRQEGIGGSDASAVAGFNKWKSPFAVYVDKVEPIEETEINQYQEWGTLLEPVIRDKFKKDHPEFTVRQSNIMWQHPEHDFMLANVDGFIHSEEKGWGVLEVKTASFQAKKEWSGEKVPDPYLIQMQHYLAVTGCEWGYFAVLFHGNEYNVWYVERDDELITSLIDIERDFWENNVLARQAPELDGSEASKEYLTKVFSIEDFKTDETELPQEAMDLFEQYKQAAESEKELKRIKDEASNRLKNMLGDHKTGKLKGHKVTWSKFYRKNVDVKRLEEEKPEVFKEYVSLKPSSQFKISVEG